MIVLALRVALGVFFVWSGAVKLLDVNAFVTAVGNFQIVFPPVDALVAYFLPWLEVFAGLALMAGVLWRGALWLILAQLVVFAGVSLSAVVRGLNINCGCFGSTSTEPTNWDWHFAILAVLAVVTVALLWDGRRYSREERVG